jgi:hypothetical protein
MVGDRGLRERRGEASLKRGDGRWRMQRGQTGRVSMF